MVGDPLAHFVEGSKDSIAVFGAVDRRQRYVEIPIGVIDLDVERTEVTERRGFRGGFEKRDELRVDGRATFAEEIRKGSIRRVFTIHAEQLKERSVRIPNSAIRTEHCDRTRSAFEEAVVLWNADWLVAIIASLSDDDSLACLLLSATDNVDQVLRIDRMVKHVIDTVPHRVEMRAEARVGTEPDNRCRRSTPTKLVEEIERLDIREIEAEEKEYRAAFFGYTEHVVGTFGEDGLIAFASEYVR